MFGMGFADGVEVSVMVEDSENAKMGTLFGIMLKDGNLRPSDEDVHVNDCASKLAAFRTIVEGNRVRTILEKLRKDFQKSKEENP